MKPGELRGHVSVTRPTSAAQRVQQTSLVGITVTGNRPVKTERAANALAKRAVAVISPYVDRKIETYNKTLETLQTGIDSVTQPYRAERGARPAGPVLPREVDHREPDRQRGAAPRRPDRAADPDPAAPLAGAERRARSLYQRAAAVKTTARSTRTSVLVGAVLGLLAGIAAALIWDGVVRRRAT